MEVKDIQREMLLVDIIKERDEIILKMNQYIQELEKQVSELKSSGGNSLGTTDTEGSKK